MEEKTEKEPIRSICRMDKKEFKDLLKQNKCPFCKKPLSYYHGFLGYEALKCTCGFFVDHSGIHLEEND